MSEISEKAFRSAMGLFPSGVTVVAADDGADAHALTVASFISVSLDPLLALASIRATSPLLPILRRAEAFAVHVLGAEQEAVARLFAEGRPEDRAAALIRRPGAPPRIAGCLARFELALFDERGAGDHALIVGRVTALETAAPPRAPLTWWRSRLGALSPTSEADIGGAR